MKEESYDVGQVIYLLSAKNTNVFPAKITEKIIRKTIEASITDYMIVLPDKKSTVVKLRDISALPFSSIEALRDFMNENARNSIESMIESALANGKKIFEDVKDYQENSPAHLDVAKRKIESKKPPENGVNTDEYVSIQLQDGKKARINIENLQKMGLQ